MVEAKYSKHKLNNLLIYSVVCLVVAGWFAYDGYISKDFIEKHTIEGKPDTTLVFNQKSPPVFVIVGAAFFANFLIARKRRVLAGNMSLSVPGKGEITYESMTEISHDDGSYFIQYVKDGIEKEIELSARKYDGLSDLMQFVSGKVTDKIE
ncbi:hypothetical protein SMSP2_00284 [Limihaloglobus sulfuriphilus]|uniref:Uncharacterized protein n=1 Tax=Limihaloglobus sulfuriphilus TaxID=1851148 RepID=A0A1Q2MBB4_9BACT|nr:hypothetical protein [Limihaloglobus sulfuriphilus]AQQ69950.1 hypothetical protein SMSP2_00284 [Limihaloglobus sulfuriphilus]